MQLLPEQKQQTDLTLGLLREEIARQGGAITFQQFMQMALYAPGAGYYVNGTRKFGEQGDFVTAPEVSSLFSQCLARQLAQILPGYERPRVLEFGAGSGRMAADILLTLEALDCLPEQYAIVELSPMLKALQQETLTRLAPHLLPRVAWLESLPTAAFEGVVLGNEVLDAMPVARFRSEQGDVLEAFVRSADEGLSLSWQPASTELEAAVRELEARYGRFDDGYSSEINPQLQPWLHSIADFLQRGLVLLIDYGYSGAEYYHPQRHMGTLIAHFRHQAHDDVLAVPGLQDITANVDFTALAHAGLDAGMQLAGYTTQAFFLLGNGIDRFMQQVPPEQQLAASSALKQLTLPTAMGERFKVIGLQKGLDDLPLSGFAMRDMREYL